MNAPKCHKCFVPMVESVAIENTLVSGMPDFAGDKRGMTVRYGGTGKVISCWKCPKCGHSMTQGGR